MATHSETKVDLILDNIELGSGIAEEAGVCGTAMPRQEPLKSGCSFPDLACHVHTGGAGELDITCYGHGSREDIPDVKPDSDSMSGLGKEVLLLMKALNTLATPEEKLAALCKKYADLLEESRSVQKQMKALQKMQPHIVKEKVHLQGEHSKAVLARSKLESLCRELQRHNKTLKEENTQKSRDYDERRREATLHFQTTLGVVEAQMEQQSVHTRKLQLENLELADKLKRLLQQYEVREEHIDLVFRQKEQQQVLVDVKVQRTTELLKELEKNHQKEQDFLLKEASLWRHECQVMKDQELQLKQQLSLYMDKFEEFQTTLTKSNEVFTTFRQQMEKMTKKIQKLEKETMLWRTKWETNNQALLQMAEEKAARDQRYNALQGKVERLEKLYRALQRERNDLCQSVQAIQGPPANHDHLGEGPPEPQPVEKHDRPSPVQEWVEPNGSVRLLSRSPEHTGDSSPSKAPC